MQEKNSDGAHHVVRATQEERRCCESIGRSSPHLRDAQNRPLRDAHATTRRDMTRDEMHVLCGFSLCECVRRVAARVE
jgi:hypothetical protein